MKKYICHKEVEAGRIVQILAPNQIFLDGQFTPEKMDIHWLIKHNPAVGGYLVKYKDGYLSYSPALAFEEGYTLVE